MIAEAEVEAKLAEQFAAALETEGLPEPRTELSWGVADPGEVKGSGDASDVVLAISVGIRSYPEYVSPQCDLPCAVALTIRRDACPTGSKLASYIKPLLDLLHSWQSDIDAVCSAFAEMSFAPSGFIMSGGERRQADDAWVVAFDFTIRGVI